MFLSSAAPQSVRLRIFALGFGVTHDDFGWEEARSLISSTRPTWFCASGRNPQHPPRPVRLVRRRAHRQHGIWLAHDGGRRALGEPLGCPSPGCTRADHLRSITRISELPRMHRTWQDRQRSRKMHGGRTCTNYRWQALMLARAGSLVLVCIPSVSFPLSLSKIAGVSPILLVSSRGIVTPTDDMAGSVASQCGPPCGMPRARCSYARHCAHLPCPPYSCACAHLS